jgi:outer membrane protease
MDKGRRVLTFAAIFLLASSVLCRADDLDPDWQSQVTPPLYTTRVLALHSGFLQGYTKYHINFDGGASELEFPLDVPVWGVKGILGYKSRSSDLNETARLTFTYLTNTSQDAGKMKDSDWIDDGVHDGLDIYSESDTELKAELFAFDYYYNLYPNQLISFGPLAGYLVQKFKYRIYNTVQVGYGPYSSFATLSVSSKTLDYYVRYEAIYLGAGLISGNIEDITFNAGFGYSPWAKASDRDDHVQRKKLSEGEANGSVYIFKGDAEWHFASQWSLQAAGQYQKFNTDGAQHQTSYDDPPNAGDFNDVDDKISAVHYFITVGVAYYF